MEINELLSAGLEFPNFGLIKLELELWIVRTGEPFRRTASASLRQPSFVSRVVYRGDYVT